MGLFFSRVQILSQMLVIYLSNVICPHFIDTEFHGGMECHEGSALGGDASTRLSDGALPGVGEGSDSCVCENVRVVTPFPCLPLYKGVQTAGQRPADALAHRSVSHILKNSNQQHFLYNLSFEGHLMSLLNGLQIEN